MKKPLPKRQKLYWQDDTYYFLTSSTFIHYPYFREDDQKQIVLSKIKQVNQFLKVPIVAYSISMNHFHLKFYLKEGKLMTKVRNMLHSGISREYRKIYEVPYKEFWQSTKIYYIGSEDMSWKVTGYIIGNLLKHKEVSRFKDLKASPFSSYKHTSKTLGERQAQDLVRSVIDVGENAEGVVDIEEMKELR